MTIQRTTLRCDVLAIATAVTFLIAACGESACPSGSMRVGGRCEATLTGDDTSSIEGSAEAGIGSGDLPDRVATSDAASDGSAALDSGAAPDSCEGDRVLENGACVRDPCLPTTEGTTFCDPNATCSYEGSGQASCSCDEGYEGDGMQCTRDVCVTLEGEEPACGAHASCEPLEAGEHACPCDEGFADCNEEPDDGCEAEISDDAEHCGACKNACAAGLECHDSVCAQRVSAIALGYVNGLFLTADKAVLGAGASPLLRTGSASTSPVAINVGRASQLSIHYDHACAMLDAGTGSMCWGSNANLQLGSTNLIAAYADLALPGIRSISAGDQHTCLINAGGRVFCWGRGTFGELGDGVSRGAEFAGRSFAEALGGASGLPVSHVEHATDVHAGRTLNCALTEAGLVYCWGGDGVTAYAPELVRDAAGAPLADVVAISGGATHACAIRADDSLVCWGDATDGKLGSSDAPANRNRHVEVALEDVRSVACAFQHSCAVLRDGSAYCWGNNSRGQLGSGDTQASTTPTPTPVLMQDLPPAISVHAGAAATGTCMRVATGAVYCWGDNYYGQLGIGDIAIGSFQATPTEIATWP